MRDIFCTYIHTETISASQASMAKNNETYYDSNDEINESASNMFQETHIFTENND